MLIADDGHHDKDADADEGHHDKKVMMLMMRKIIRNVANKKKDKTVSGNLYLHLMVVREVKYLHSGQ